MALDKFLQKNQIIQLVLDQLNKALVFAALSNTQTPANLGKAKSYDIPGIGSITIGDYVQGTDITIQNVDDTGKTLTIDQQKYFAFKHDKVDSAEEAFSTIALFGNEGAYKLANAADIHIASKYSSEAGIVGSSSYSIGTPEAPYAITEANVLDWISEVVTAMDDNNVPEGERWQTIPPFVYQAIVKAQIQEDATVNEAARTNGFVGKYLGLNLYKSNNLAYSPVATLTFDADFVTSNTIDLKVDGTSIAQQTFDTNQATTAAALAVAIKALSNVVDCTVDATGRIYTIKGSTLTNLVTEVTVAAGASQAAGTVTYARDASSGIRPIASNPSALVYCNTLKDFEIWDKVEKSFGEMMKGLHVYGTKVKDPLKVVRGVVSKG